LTYAGFVASVGWLRWASHRFDGLKTSLLFGSVLAFNWLWLIGMYNFTLSIIILIAAYGLFVYWDAEMNWKRALSMSGIFLLAYFSNLIGFATIILLLFLYCVVRKGRKSLRSLGWLAIAALPTVPLFLLYGTLADQGGTLDVSWRVQRDQFALSAFLLHLRSIDPFIILNRRSIPFVDAMSDLARIGSPIIWIVVAIGLLVAGTVVMIRRDRDRMRQIVPHAACILVLLLLALVSPDELGKHGGLLRPRFLLCATALFTAVFMVARTGWNKRAAQVILAAVFIFQVAALTDFALRSDSVTREYLSVEPAIADGERVASLVILDELPKSLVNPPVQIDALIGTLRPIFVWDNYEFGYYQFPVIARDAEDREFVGKFYTAKVFELYDPPEAVDKKLAALDSVLAANHDKIDVMLVWGRDPRGERVIEQWFDPTPFFENGRIRAYRNRSKTKG